MLFVINYKINYDLKFQSFLISSEAVVYASVQVSELLETKDSTSLFVFLCLYCLFL